MSINEYRYDFVNGNTMLWDSVMQSSVTTDNSILVRVLAAVGRVQKLLLPHRIPVHCITSSTPLIRLMVPKQFTANIRLAMSFVMSTRKAIRRCDNIDTST